MPIAEEGVWEETEYVFTDRVDEQHIFNSLYNNIKKNEYEVINFWGIPGIGKSYLGQRLQDEVKRRGNNHSYIKIDFSKNMNEMYEYLEELAIKLSEERNFVFPIFSVAISFYCYQRLGERRDISSIESAFKNHHPFLYKLISPAVAIAGVAPTVGYIAEFIDAIKESYGSEVRAYIEEHKKELLKIEKYDLHQLEKKLSFYFSIDYNANISKDEHPIVIFLDTYESHVNELACVGYEYENDRWLRDERYGIVSKCKYTLWVITGREKIKWDELSDFWKGKIHCHEMLDFSREYAKEYLRDKGIIDTTVVTNILNAAKGVPFHLYLSVEYYYQQIKAGLNANEIDFGTDYEDVFIKYIQYMNDEEKTIVYLMACMGRWKKEDFINTNLLTSMGARLTLERVHKLSFVKTADKDGYYLHAEAEEILQRRCPYEIKQQYYDFIMDRKEDLSLSLDKEVRFFANMIRTELTPMYISTHEIMHSDSVVRTKRNVSILKEAFDKNRPLLERYLVNKEYAFFEEVISLFLQVIEDTFEPNEDEKNIFVDILRILLMYYIAREWNQNAVDVENELIELLKNMSSVDEKEIIEEQYRKLSMMIAVPHSKLILQELEDLYDAAKQALGEEHDTTNGICVLRDYQKMVYSRGYEIDVVERFVFEEKRLYGENSPKGIKAEINWAYAYKIHGKYEKAIEIGEQLLEKMDCWLEEYDVDYMHAIDNLAAAYHGYGMALKGEGRSAEAKDLFVRGYELAKNVYNISIRKGQRNSKEEKEHFGYIYRVIFSIALMQDFTDGESYCEEALANPCFVKADRECKQTVYDTMACVCMWKRDWRNAAFYVKKVYELACLIQGPKSPDTIHIYARWKTLLDVARNE